MESKQLLLVFFMIITSLSVFSQSNDSARKTLHFSGSAAVTNNGMSLVPNFSLGKPAVVFLLSFGGPRFSIDPDIRFSLEAKPWTFLFWARYKLFYQGRFRMTTGAHLGLNHRRTTEDVNGISVETNVVRRYFATEVAPNYLLGKNVSVGVYYLYSRGLDNGTIANGHFVTFNTNFSHIALPGQLYFRATPTFYYLNQDGRHGTYAMITITLARERFPVSISSILVKSIQSDIIGSKDFNWNLSLIYSFNRNYLPQLPLR